MSQRTYQKKLRVEQLEAKTLLAGDVSVSVLGGNLFIIGDEMDNVLELQREGAIAGDFKIEERGGGTINGGGNELIVNGVTGDVYVSLKGGSDTFRAIDADLPDDLFVWGGEGDDTLILGIPENDLLQIPLPITVADDVIFKGGDGADTLEMRDFTIGSDLVFSGDHGDDVVVMQPDLPLSSGSTIGNDAILDTGSGLDEVGIEAVTINDDLVISTGNDDDVVSVLEGTTVVDSTTVSLGLGTNILAMEAVDAGESLVVYGGGTNFITLAAVQVSEFLKVCTSSGGDEIMLIEVTAPTAIISTDGGADSLAIIDSAFECLFVSLGSGNDSLTIEGELTDIGIALLFGGSGEDELVIDENSMIDLELAFSFEA
jgi:hypothetical protein